MTKVYILRVCRADMTSRNGFKWPDVGHEAVAQDWIANNKCGNGLHGWLHGVGGYDCVDYWRDADAKWLVIEADVSDIIDLGDKVKFKKGVVRFVGAKVEAAAFLDSVDDVARDSAVIGAARVVGDGKSVMVGALGIATAGDRGTTSAGYKGTATAGRYGKASTGDEGTATTGRYGTASAGVNGKASTGDEGTAAAGRYGTASAGNSGTATAGRYGTATAGNYGTASAGRYGTASVGVNGKASAGVDGILTIYYINKQNKRRLATAYVGVKGIKPDTFYRVDHAGKFIEVTND